MKELAEKLQHAWNEVQAEAWESGLIAATKAGETLPENIDEIRTLWIDGRLNLRDLRTVMENNGDLRSVVLRPAWRADDVIKPPRAEDLDGMIMTLRESRQSQARQPRHA